MATEVHNVLDEIWYVRNAKIRTMLSQQPFPVAVLRVFFSICWTVIGVNKSFVLTVNWEGTSCGFFFFLFFFLVINFYYFSFCVD